jgi:hypothetical protein
VSLAVSAFWMLAVPVSHADPVQTLDCRDATAAELAGRSGGTTCSWTMPTPTVTACASFEVLATGPYVMGGDGPDSSSSVAASLMRWTVFHPATTFAEGHRLDVQVRCSESSVTGWRVHGGSGAAGAGRGNQHRADAGGGPVLGPAVGECGGPELPGSGAAPDLVCDHGAGVGERTGTSAGAGAEPGWAQQYDGHLWWHRFAKPFAVTYAYVGWGAFTVAYIWPVQ